MSAKRSVWRMHDHADEADKVFQRTRRAVLESTDYRCEFCGFQSTKFQEVHHGDDNHQNNAPENLYSACPLCHQVFHIGLAGMKEGGDLVYLPELTQAEINQFALVIWMVGQTDRTKFRDPQHALVFERLSKCAQRLEGMLSNRRGTILLRLKPALEQTSFPKELINKIKLSYLTPTLLSNALMSLPDALYEQRADLMGGLRLFPISTRFRERIKHWNEEQSSVLPIPAWYQIIPEEDINNLIEICTEKITSITAQPSAAG